MKLTLVSLCAQEGADVQSPEHLLGPVSTRNLLVCFLWVLKNIDKELVQSWWAQLSITRSGGAQGVCWLPLLLILSYSHISTFSYSHTPISLHSHTLILPYLFILILSYFHTPISLHSHTLILPYSHISSFSYSHTCISTFRLNTLMNVLDLSVACFEYRVSQIQSVYMQHVHVHVYIQHVHVCVIVLVAECNVKCL